MARARPGPAQKYKARACGPALFYFQYSLAVSQRLYPCSSMNSIPKLLVVPSWLTLKWRWKNGLELRTRGAPLRLGFGILSISPQSQNLATCEDLTEFRLDPVGNTPPEFPGSSLEGELICDPSSCRVFDRSRVEVKLLAKKLPELIGDQPSTRGSADQMGPLIKWNSRNKYFTAISTQIQ